MAGGSPSAIPKAKSRSAASSPTSTPYNTQMCRISKAEGYDPELFPITKEYADKGWGVPGKTPVVDSFVSGTVPAAEA